MKEIIMLKQIMPIVILTTLSGCVSITGETDYTLEPMKLPSGEVVCCKAHIRNSKDYDKLQFKMVKKPDGTIEVELVEKGVSASDPATVNAENQQKLLDIMTKVIPTKVNN